MKIQEGMTDDCKEKTFSFESDDDNSAGSDRDPGGLSCLAGVILFGAWKGFLCNYIGICAGSVIAFLIAKQLGRPLMEAVFKKKQIVAMSNGIDTGYFHPDKGCRSNFRRRYGLEDNDRVVISVGHYIQRKGLPEFVELARKMPDVHFFWFGHTSLELVPRRIREAMENAPANVSFPGYIEREEMREAYCGCDLFCFMSHEETEGIVVLEALACGTPTIVRDIPVYDGWLRDGENVYKADSDEDFAVKTRAVLDGKLPSLTEAGRDTALERSYGNIAEKLRCCEELLDTKNEFVEDAAGQHI